MKNKKHLGIEDLKSKMDTHANFILVDVLSPEDYKNAHIKGAINIPLEQLDKKANEWLNRNIDIIVYSANTQCKGARFAQEKLGTMGFRVWTLDGGLEAWETAFYPLEGNPNYKPHVTTERPTALEPKKAAPAKPEAKKTEETPDEKKGGQPQDRADRPWERYGKEKGKQKKAA